MTPSRSRTRRPWHDLTARVIYHGGLVPLVNRFVSRWEGSRPGGDAGRFPFVRRRRGRTLQILAYHRVTEREDPFLPSLKVDVFERQMECLARYFRVLPLEESVAAWIEGSLPGDVVCLTFDDGYRDNYQYAFPILKRLRLSATIFLTTGFIGSRRLLWHDRVFRAFALTEVQESWSSEASGAAYRLSDQESRTSSRDRVLAHLRSLPPEERDARIDGLVRQLNVDESSLADRMMLDWDEVREMRLHGVAFGSHTVTHPVLSRIPTDRAEWEILESKRVLEERLQTEVSTFAYPNGRAQDYTEETHRILARAGYTCAVTTEFGSNPSSEDHGTRSPWELKRESSSDGDPAIFAAKLNAHRFLA